VNKDVYIQGSSYHLVTSEPSFVRKTIDCMHQTGRQHSMLSTVAAYSSFTKSDDVGHYFKPGIERVQALAYISRSDYVVIAIALTIPQDAARSVQ